VGSDRRHAVGAVVGTTQLNEGLSLLQVGAIQRLKVRLHARLCDSQTPSLESSAVVFAPHQDDETLGCGGTIILKRERATSVACVFMTDGTTSHQNLIDKKELGRIRKAEAEAAATILGLARHDVHFLDFPDSRLGSCHSTAMDRVTDLLRRYKPDEVYVPYRRDGTADHEATYTIVLDALHRIGRRTRVLEYPIWFWNRWPWVPLKLHASRDTLAALGGIVDARFGLELFREFRSGVFVGKVMERKRSALAQHRSQMTALLPETSWPTLGGVSDGRFLECLLQEFEVFRSSDFPGTGPPEAVS
jgi:LmbE family N-acetylglucosaminyl deacetylase